MWARLSSALKSTTSRHDEDDQSQLEQQPSQVHLQSQSQLQDAGTWNSNQTFDQTQTQNLTFGMDRTNNQSHTEVMALLLEQHPNMSAFHNGDGASASSSTSTQPSSVLPPPLSTTPPPFSQPQPSPPPSLSSKRSFLKRGSKDKDKDKDHDSVRGSSSLKLFPKKIRGSLPFGNGLQRSSSRASLATVETHSDEHTSKQQTKPRRSQDTLRSFASAVRRPSLDLIRQATGGGETPRPSLDSPIDNKANSVRSILRDPNTPGTGQNVRFFSSDAFKVISPEESMEESFLSPPSQVRAPDHSSFVDRLNQLGTSHTSTPNPNSRVSSPPSKSRPSLKAVFGPLESSPNNDERNGLDVGFSPASSSGDFMSLSGPVSAPDFNANGSLDMDGQADLPVFPPGLDGSPLLDSGMDLSFSGMSSDEGKVTSTPFKPRSKRANVKGKERDESIKEDDEYEEYRPKGEETEVEGILTALVSPSRVIDESVFHARERAPVFSPPLHERSQSFSFGQTMFFSMGKNSPSNPLPPPHPSSSSVLPSDTGSSNPSHLQSLSPPTIPPGSIGRHRSRALSDTVFQSMLRSASPAFSKSSTTPSAPEAEINDECSADVQIYANPRSPPSEPDPFNANANTYYTPQTMIPTTPPSGVITHTRKTSKEENLIYSLQTQLTLQTELCSQFEADLRAKDEMVELLSKKLADVEKQENRRRGALKGWKKKVQELERAVRMLEEEVDSSRRESMERSVMDEASGEALRMLHRQIASLEQEKKEWLVREAELKGEVENLEKLMKEREEEIINLKEMLRKGEELDSRSKEAMLGNGSLVGVNEEELKRLAEREQNVNQERQAYRAAEMGWEQERAELIMKLESVEVEKTNIEEQLDSLKGQLKAKEEEFGVMKNELEAQWSHTETASEKIAQLQQAKKSAEEEVIDVKREKEEVVKERDVLVQRCEEVEERANAIEQDWNESESKNHELECEVHELWDEKEALEKEREQFEQQLVQERERSEGLNSTIRECEDRIAQLEEERQLTAENVNRLEDDLLRRDEEISRYSQQLREQELEAENLHEEIEKLEHDYERVVNEHSLTLKEASGSESETRRQLQDLVRQKAGVDEELKSTKERNESLKNEMERLRNHVHDLQQESADKEVRIVQLEKQHGQDKEDIQGLNMALDAKQQEVALYKRKMSIKTTTPPSASSSSLSAKVAHRRESSTLFDGTTPASTRPPSRATSVVSDTGSTANAKGEKVSALGKSSRINSLNGLGTVSSTGSAIKIASKRPSPSSAISPTPTARPSSAAATTASSRMRSTTDTAPSRVKSPTGTGAPPVRRVVSVSGRNATAGKLKAGLRSPTSPSSISEETGSEKENVPRVRSLTAASANLRRSTVPAPM